MNAAIAIDTYHVSKVEVMDNDLIVTLESQTNGGRKTDFRVPMSNAPVIGSTVTLSWADA